PGDEPRAAGHAAAVPLPGGRAVLHQGRRVAVPGRGAAERAHRCRAGGVGVTTTELGMPELGGLAGVPAAEGEQTAKEFKSDQEVRWCPGCGDYVVLNAVQSFLPSLGLRRE